MANILSNLSLKILRRSDWVEQHQPGSRLQQSSLALAYAAVSSTSVVFASFHMAAMYGLNLGLKPLAGRIPYPTNETCQSEAIRIWVLAQATFYSLISFIQALKGYTSYNLEKQAELKLFAWDRMEQTSNQIREKLELFHEPYKEIQLVDLSKTISEKKKILDEATCLSISLSPSFYPRTKREINKAGESLKNISEKIKELFAEKVQYFERELEAAKNLSFEVFCSRLQILRQIHEELSAAQRAFPSLTWDRAISSFQALTLSYYWLETNLRQIFPFIPPRLPRELWTDVIFRKFYISDLLPLRRVSRRFRVLVEHELCRRLSIPSNQIANEVTKLRQEISHVPDLWFEKEELYFVFAYLMENVRKSSVQLDQKKHPIPPHALDALLDRLRSITSEDLLLYERMIHTPSHPTPNLTHFIYRSARFQTLNVKPEFLEESAKKAIQRDDWVWLGVLFAHGADPNKFVESLQLRKLPLNILLILARNNYMDNFGDKLIHLVARRENRPDFVRAWKEEGGSLEECSGFGNSPLFIAILYNKPQMVELLLTLEPNLINSRSKCGDSPLFTAITYDNPQMVQLLLDLGANPKEPKIGLYNNALELAKSLRMKRNSQEIIKILSKYIYD